MDVINSLLRAARAGNLKRVVEFIEDELVDINGSNQNGLTALHSASKEGHTRIVEELISRGANVHARTLKGNTALHIASLAGHEPVVRLLIENGADVDAQSVSGFTALYMAAQENHESIVKLLLASGANQNIATTDGFTVSYLSSSNLLSPTNTTTTTQFDTLWVAYPVQVERVTASMCVHACCRQHIRMRGLDNMIYVVLFRLFLIMHYQRDQWLTYES